MTATTLPDFTITCSSRRRACVIDSALALSVYGLPIAKQLGEWLELWVVREFWHLLEARDATRFVLPQLTPSMERALQEWERLRQHVDSQHRPVNVLADVLGDSSLPAGSDPDLIWRWESLAQALDRLLEAQGLPIDAPTMASRDLVALAAARNACILTLRSAAEPQAPPVPLPLPAALGDPLLADPRRQRLGRPRRGPPAAAVRERWPGPPGLGRHGSVRRASVRAQRRHPGVHPFLGRLRFWPGVRRGGPRRPLGS